jgi:SAM-dependent methyltransferase
MRDRKRKSFFHFVLRFILPKWVADDFYHRFSHPYWTRGKVKFESVLTRSEGVTKKIEKTSSRQPFKRINGEHVLSCLRKNKVETILDVGCGSGHLVSLLNSNNFKSCGITINSEEIKNAQSKNIYLCDVQDFESLKRIGIDHFDAILSFDCIEHLDRPLEALKNINKLLKKDGLFISYIPPVRWVECDYHVVVYSPRQYRWLLNLSGFDLIESEGRYLFSKRGVTYYARKATEGEQVYPGILQ